MLRRLLLLSFFSASCSAVIILALPQSLSVHGWLKNLNKSKNGELALPSLRTPMFSSRIAVHLWPLHHNPTLEIPRVNHTSTVNMMFGSGIPLLWIVQNLWVADSKKLLAFFCHVESFDFLHKLQFCSTQSTIWMAIHVPRMVSCTLFRCRKLTASFLWIVAQLRNMCWSRQHVSASRQHRNTCQTWPVNLG